MHLLCGPHSLLQAHFDASRALVPVSFRLHAPAARAVYLIGEMTRWREAKLPLRRGADGVWRLTLSLGRGQWFYKFEVDGEWIADPENPLRAEDGIGHGGCHSYLFVGEGGWTPRAGAPRGEQVEMSIASRLLEGPLPFTVYFPPETGRRTDYPLLMLLHGHEMRRNQWPDNGCLAAYMDNALADGLIEPFVVVMPSGHHGAPMELYGRSLVEELLPWLSRRLPVDGRRALAGMSIRGYGPLALALRHPAAFGYVAPVNEIFSDEVLARAAAAPDFPFLLSLYCTLEGCARPRYDTLLDTLRRRGRPVACMRAAGCPTWRHWNALTPELLSGVDGFFRRLRQGADARSA